MSRLLAAMIVLGAVTAGLLLLGASPAAALSAPSVSRSDVTVGDSITISGTGCVDSPGTPLPGVSLQGGLDFRLTGSAGPDGAWSFSPRLNSVGVTYLSAVCRLSTGDVPYPQVTVVVSPAPVPIPTGTVAPPPPAVPPTRVAGPSSVAPPPRTPWRSRGPAIAPVPQQTTAPEVPASPTGAGTPRPTRSPGPSATSSPIPLPAPPSSPEPAAPGAGAPLVPTASCRDCATVAGTRPLSAGRELALAYSGFQPEERVTVVLRSTPVTLGTFTADGAGVVSADLALPDDAEPGAHTLTFSGPVSGDLVLPIRIGAPDVAGVSTTARAPAAAAGVPPWAPVLGGTLVALLTAGGVVLHRRRAATR